MTADPNRLRTASVQWEMTRPASLDEFLERAVFWTEAAVVDSAADIVIFPEYFTLPLAALAPGLPAAQSIRWLAAQTERVNRALAELAEIRNAWIVAGSQPVIREGELFNVSFAFGPQGRVAEQAKLHITPWERQAWQVAGGGSLQVIDCGKARIGVQICYDVEFPEPSRRLAEEGLEVLLVPYCTDDRRGHLRVSRCAMARAVENQIAVITAGCVGALRGVEAANVHYAQSAAYTPNDVGFPWDGIAAQADACQPQLLVAEIDLEALRRSRGEGTVTPLKDRRRDLFG